MKIADRRFKASVSRVHLSLISLLKSLRRTVQAIQVRANQEAKVAVKAVVTIARITTRMIKR